MIKLLQEGKHSRMENTCAGKSLLSQAKGLK